MAELILQEEIATPTTPATNKWKAYFKSNGLYIIDDTGNEIGPLSIWGGIQGTLSNQADLDKMLNFPQGLGQNYVITPSVATNNLTVALKTIAGTDPSSVNPVRIRIGNTRQTITTALSTTKNAGTNWCNAGSSEMAGNPIDFFVYLIQETGASAGTKIGFSRIPYARIMSDFVNTTTDEKYIAGNWVNFNSTDEVENIGRFRAQLSAATAYNWSIPSALVINRPIYETDWLVWQPAYSASGSMTYTSVTTNHARYKIRRDTIEVCLKANGTTGGTASNEIRATVPFEASLIATLPTVGGALCSDGGARFGGVYCSAGTPDNFHFVKYDNSNFGLGAGRVISTTLLYQI